MRQRVKFIGILLALCFTIACAGTPTQNRLMTADTFNSIYEQYLDAFDRQSGTTQQKWMVEIDPLFAEASAAMGAYMAITDPSSSNAANQLAIYEAARDQAVRLLLTYGIEIKEE